MNRPILHPQNILPAAGLTLAGALVLALWATGVFPSIPVLQTLSGNANLSEPLVALLRQSQGWLGISLICGGLAAWLASRARKKFPSVFRSPSARSFIWIVAMMGVGIAWIVQQAVFDGIPHVTDASSHWFQAQVYRSGSLAAPAPPCPDAFYQHGVVMGRTGLWHTKYYPGTALGMAGLGKGFVPIAFGVFLAAFYSVLRRYFDELEARWAVTLFCASPLMLLLAGSFMSHVPLLAWMALAWALALRSMANGRGGWAAAAGVSVGMGILTRPLDGCLLGAIMGLALVLDPRFSLPRKLAAAGWGVMGLAIPTAMVLVQNHFLYGAAWTTGYNFSHSSANYHVYFGLSEQFPLSRAMLQSGWILAKLNQALLGWPTSFLFIVYAFLATPTRKSNYVLALIAIAAYIPYFLYFYYGFEFEARYTFSTIPFLCAGSALGIRTAMRSRWGRWIPGLLASFYIYALTYYWPVYLLPRYSSAYEESTPAIHRAAQETKLELPALVLLPNNGFIYTSGFIYNDPKLDNPIVYARDIPGLIPCLIQSFPNRHLYRFVPSERNRYQGIFAPVEELESVTGIRDSTRP